MYTYCYQHQATLGFLDYSQVMVRVIGDRKAELCPKILLKSEKAHYLLLLLFLIFFYNLCHDAGWKNILARIPGKHCALLQLLHHDILHYPEGTLYIITLLQCCTNLLAELSVFSCFGTSMQVRLVSSFHIMLQYKHLSWQKLENDKSSPKPIVVSSLSRTLNRKIW